MDRISWGQIFVNFFFWCYSHLFTLTRTFLPSLKARKELQNYFLAIYIDRPSMWILKNTCSDRDIAWNASQILSECLSASWKLSENFLKRTWILAEDACVLSVHCLNAAWMLAEYCLNTVWLLSEYYLGPTRLLPEHCLDVFWMLPGNCFYTGCIFPD